ncbi:hypothetical protein MVEN_00098700 [Mycena venus]|uniref:C2H2-type domain-containing protein n=1 Tax=Mycena venus TaxID=2733690 RepID=A0A8H6Z4X5_9AGAR|nr:hypothetical protein MVEN_00098700 [Mycena venus]
MCTRPPEAIPCQQHYALLSAKPFDRAPVELNPWTSMSYPASQCYNLFPSTETTTQRNYGLPWADELFLPPPTPFDGPSRAVGLPGPRSISYTSFQPVGSSSATVSSTSPDVGSVNCWPGLLMSFGVSEDINSSYPQIFSAPEACDLRLSSPHPYSEPCVPPLISIEPPSFQVEHREQSHKKRAEKMGRFRIDVRYAPNGFLGKDLADVVIYRHSHAQSRPSALKAHLNVHNNARPYPCGFPDCPKTYKIRSNARRHHRGHLRKLGLPTSPNEAPQGVQFAEHINAPLPPPSQHHQALFHIRWNEINTTTRKNIEYVEAETDKQETDSPVFIHEPFPGVRPSARQKHNIELWPDGMIDW